MEADAAPRAYSKKRLLLIVDEAHIMNGKFLHLAPGP